MDEELNLDLPRTVKEAQGSLAAIEEVMDTYYTLALIGKASPKMSVYLPAIRDILRTYIRALEEKE